MQTVILTVDCKAAHHDRCYTMEIVRLAERHEVPLTWLIHVSSLDSSANTELYYREYFHKIPSWHEIGLNVHFENDRGYVDDPKERGKIIQMAKDVLKSHRVKPTSFRAGCFALQASDIRYLEDIGVLVDSSSVAGSDYKMFVDWTGGPSEPYFLSYDDVRLPGDSKVLEIPIACAGGRYGYVESSFEELLPTLEALSGQELVCLGMRDYANCLSALEGVLDYYVRRGAQFVTLTQAASEWRRKRARLSLGTAT
jgi:hypothetical protein